MQRLIVLPVLTVMLAATTTALAIEEIPEGTTVHFLGDSIFKGFGFADYSNPSPLARIQDICTVLMDRNLGSHAQISRVSREGDNAGYTPDALVKKLVGTGEIDPNDWVIYEDAADARLYRDYRSELGRIHEAAEGNGRTVIFMTMFDYVPPSYPAYYFYDAPTADVPVKTINDAIRDEGVVRGNRVIDMNAMMDGYQTYLKDNGWGSPVLPDGVHPNVFGNTIMAFRLLRTMGYNIDTWDITPIEQRFLHPTAGDVSNLTTSPWIWPQDATDAQRRSLVQTARAMSALPAEPNIVSVYEVEYVAGGVNHPIPSLGFWNPSNADLINTGSPALAGVTTNFQQETPGFLSFPNPALHNGTALANDSDAVFDDNGFSVTFALNISEASNGYNITGIDTYAAGPNSGQYSRGDQHYELLVEFVDDPGNFVSLGTFDAITGGQRGGTKLMIRGGGGASDSLAEGVSAVRFVIADAPIDAFYREFDVFGSRRQDDTGADGRRESIGHRGGDSTK